MHTLRAKFFSPRPSVLHPPSTSTSASTPHGTRITSSPPPRRKSSRLFLVLLGTLRLGCASELLGSILALFPLLSAGLFDLGGVADTNESVVGFELLHGLDRVVDQGEPGGLATTVLRPHAEHVDLVLVGLVHFGEFRAEVVLGDVGSVGVQDITV